MIFLVPRDLDHLYAALYQSSLCNNVTLVEKLKCFYNEDHKIHQDI